MSSAKILHNPKTYIKYTKFSKYPHNRHEYIDPEYFSCEDDKKFFCDSFRNIRRREISFSCPGPDPMGNVKASSVLEDLMRRIKKNITNTTIVEEIIGGEGEIVKKIRIALRIKSENAVYLSSFFWNFYKVFPKYHYKIQMDLSNKSSYLDRARDLISPKHPFGHVEIDKDPFVYGETLKQLMTRMENAELGVCGSRKINLSYTQELIDAAVDASGCWTRFIKKDVYRELSEKYPYHIRSAFDAFSSSPLKGLPEDPLFPTYSQCHFSNDVIIEIDSTVYTQEEQDISYGDYMYDVRKKSEKLGVNKKEECEIEIGRIREEIMEKYLAGNL